MSIIDAELNKIESPAQRAALKRIRELVASLVPEAEEVITYGMPGFKYKKRYLVSFAAFKNHLSLFPGELPTEGRLANELEPFRSSKGTLQFTAENPIPDELIKKLIAASCKRIDEGV